MNPYRALLVKWTPHRSFAKVGKAVIGPLDVLLRPTGYAISSIGSGFPTVYLTTTGRKTGQSRTVPVLAMYLGDRVGLIDTNHREDSRPGWYFNLMADPHCRIRRGRTETAYVARPANEAERDEVWRKGLEVFPAFREYADGMTRTLDVFILEPTPGG